MDLSLHVTSGGPTTAGSILRSNQAYLELLSRKTTLEHGIAFCCERFPGLRSGNQFREVMIESREEASQALGAAEAHFADLGLSCSRWALAEAQSPEPIEPVLGDAGWIREDTLAMTLTAWPEFEGREGIRVLPARPMREAFRAMWEAKGAFLPTEEERLAYAEAANERLDDHRMDAFVAMVDKQPAGVGALFQVGDIGRIIDLYVAKEFRGQGVGLALMHHFIRLARRLTMRTVCVEVSALNENGQGFLKRFGFVNDGRMVEFHRKDVARPDPADW